MMILDSLQTFGVNVLFECSKLVLTVDVSDEEYDTTSEVIACLRSRSEIASMKSQLSTLQAETTAQNQALAAQNQSLQSEITDVKYSLNTLIATLTAQQSTPAPNIQNKRKR
ncbi:hypothetical protein TL16_g11111 [Triparma laevis f. inornata]|uniref:Uncharacterized protein n=2 Tax=Triparma laevis TaxID=1534972 RepID=A0A9W7FSJ3_9STRA|nr:hypothetical protein TL16_g11111 [Triparma laevis f. inornata]GMI17201.1 hypothetical protein TrLO_g1311 [Triparma laevis f. longispina]